MRICPIVDADCVFVSRHATTPSEQVHCLRYPPVQYDRWGGDGALWSEVCFWRLLVLQRSCSFKRLAMGIWIAEPDRTKLGVVPFLREHHPGFGGIYPNCRSADW